MSYDQKCLDLARAFLSDVKVDYEDIRAHLCERLAQEIQDTIENFIEYDEEVVLNTAPALQPKSQRV